LPDFNKLNLADYTSNKEVLDKAKATMVNAENGFGFYAEPKSKSETHHLLLNLQALSCAPVDRKTYTTVHEFVHMINTCSFAPTENLEYTITDQEEYLGFGFADEFLACLYGLQFCNSKGLTCHDSVFDLSADRFVRAVNSRLCQQTDFADGFIQNLYTLLAYVTFFEQTKGIYILADILPQASLEAKKELLGKLMKNKVGEIDKSNLQEIPRLAWKLWESI